MYAKFNKMMEKRMKDKPMSDMEKDASLSALDKISSKASDLLKGKMKGLKKVTVASDSTEGLAAGLEKAEEMLPINGSHEGDEEGSEELEEARKDLPLNMEDCTEEELDEKIQELMALKAKKAAQKA